MDQRWRAARKGEDDVPATFGAKRTKAEEEAAAQAIEDASISHTGAHKPGEPIAKSALDVSLLLNDAADAIVDDSFSRCFANKPQQPWNWNVYLFPLWLAGTALRLLVLLPLRSIMLLFGISIFVLLFPIVRLLLKQTHMLQHRKVCSDGFQLMVEEKLTSVEAALVQFLAASFVASWTGVVQYHGPIPSSRGDQVIVANHTSMIDFAILAQKVPCAVIMQSHGGWIRILQRYVLSALGCIEFNRKDSKDKRMVSERLRQHVADPSNNPPLIFPEGTCVNNEFCVMFKKGAFELDCPIVPVAIRYNKTFVDAFWNSRKQSFTMHLFTLMCSWAVVCDVHFMEPQSRRENESAEEFAERVRTLIADKAGLKKVPWGACFFSLLFCPCTIPYHEL